MYYCLLSHWSIIKSNVEEVDKPPEKYVWCVLIHVLVASDAVECVAV